MLVLGISGSLRTDSYNTRLLRAAAAKLPPWARMVLWDELVEIPPFNEDRETGPVAAALGRLRHHIAMADAVLFATPEYNGSFPGQLKNALDWASRPPQSNPLRGKPAAVVGSSTGLFGAVWAQADLRRVLGVIGADVLDVELPVGQAHEAFSPRGDLIEPSLDEALADIVATLTVRRAVPAHAA
ncbi:MAG: NAD(P)H-dependent oxidoreductase [Mycobacteriales bacterium]